MSTIKKPLVSILVPIYGVEKYIERCVVSLMEQTYNNIEYIFVNDCTSDRSIEVLNTVVSRYANRIERVSLLNHDVNRGLAAARNTALDACTGDYIWHVDSDDWIALDAVEKLVSNIEENNADIIIFNNYEVREERLHINEVKYYDKESYISNILLHTIAGSVWNKFFRSDVYKDSGVRSIEGLNHGEDYVIIPRLLHKAKRISVLNEPLYYYNLTNQSSYTRNISFKSIKNVHTAYEINRQYFETVDDTYKYRDTLNMLPFRSMLALIKRVHRESYHDVIHLYPECFEYKSAVLSRSDKIILHLLKHGKYELLSRIIILYRRLSK